jgi:hypothetical protein
MACTRRCFYFFMMGGFVCQAIQFGGGVETVLFRQPVPAQIVQAGQQAENIGQHLIIEHILADHARFRANIFGFFGLAAIILTQGVVFPGMAVVPGVGRAAAITAMQQPGPGAGSWPSLFRRPAMSCRCDLFIIRSAWLASITGSQAHLIDSPVSGSFRRAW